MDAARHEGKLHVYILCIYTIFWSFVQARDIHLPSGSYYLIFNCLEFQVLIAFFLNDVCG